MDGRWPPWRSGHGPSSGPRNGNSSCEKAHPRTALFTDFGPPAPGWLAALLGIFNITSAMLRLALFLNGFRPFPPIAPLINPRHVLQGRRLLSIWTPARLSRFARAAPCPLQQSQAQGERAVGTGRRQRHAGWQPGGHRRYGQGADRRRSVWRAAQPNGAEILRGVRHAVRPVE